MNDHDQIFSQARLPGEPFEVYKKRLRFANKKMRTYLKGDIINIENRKKIKQLVTLAELMR